MQSTNDSDEQHNQKHQSPKTNPQYNPIVMRNLMLPQVVPYYNPRDPFHKRSSSGENRTIWVGDLSNWMDENYLHCCFASTGELVSIKVIRNKQTYLSEGYGFVEFMSHTTAEKVLQSYVNYLMPNTEQCFRLNWAVFSMGDKRLDNSPSDYSIFVGDLAMDVTDSLLLETFSCKYPSVKAAKVVVDINTGTSKGYGFVRFSDDEEKMQAITEMNGAYCLSRPMRIGVATPRKASGHPQYSSKNGQVSNGVSSNGFQPEGDSTNTTIFVGGLDSSVTDEDLRQPFAEHGELISVKIPLGKGCGFVHFAHRTNAETALQQLNGTVIGKQKIRLSWGRNPAKRQVRVGYGNQWNGAYYGGHVYDGYGYGYSSPHYDPNFYGLPIAYRPYHIYGMPQQQTE